MRFAQQFLRDESGVTVLEFAAVMPVLCMLILGTIEYGIIFHLQGLATHAGNEAARLGKTGGLYGSRDTREQLIENRVRQIMASWIRDEDSVTVTSHAYGTFNDVYVGGGGLGAGTGGQVVLYEVVYAWRSITPGMAMLFGEDGVIPIHAYALVKNEAF